MEKTKIRTIMVTICILIVLGFAYWTYANISDYLVVRKEWIHKTHELNKIKTEIAEIERLLSFYRKEKKDFQQYLFQEKDIPEFLDGLSGFANTTGINIVDMKTNRFQEVKVPEELTESQSTLVNRKQSQTGKEMTKEELSRLLTLAAMPINFKIEGNYQAFIEFYRHLESFKQLISISNVDVSTTNQYPILQCAFTLKIYSLKTMEELQSSRQ